MSKRNQAGFTLIEILIVIALAAVLTALVIPSYNNQTTKTRRTDAKIALTKGAAELEKCYVLHNQYNHNTCNAFPSSGADLVLSEEGHYTVVATVLQDTTFTLTASPADDSPQAGDTHCATFTITSTGVRGATNDDCW